ncbi:MAG: hypothetical protein WBX13_14670 [Candidatus Acidiferrales bacterium]
MTVKFFPNVSLDKQIEGTRKAIATLETGRGPIWLLPSHRRRLRALLEEKKRRAARAAGKTKREQSTPKTFLQRLLP